MATEPPTLTPHQTKSVLEAGALLIDLRPREEFASRHIPRSINVVFSRKSLPERIATAIPPGPPIVLLSGKADIAEAAVETLQRVDRNPLRGILASGTESWDHAGLPLATLPQVTVEILWQRLHVAHDELMLIDVREPFEWKLGYIKDSLFISLAEIWRRAYTLDPRRDIVLICEEGTRSSTAASILLHHDFPRVANVPGGMGDWFKAGHPTIRLP
ncbi:rhodanese-like domain-containing protein [Candidatus Methylomirabilis sp.]|uniref:rhodanese-like domain-containing protein n=1 Tax=Candidatus Methylomirabilis sp. TaxID=2032687 RepID=UPI002A6707F2|nr:rhodanese-like domain-containing protein [Candidatus Methylomirabilis sp.]